jgi:hypothetical protein
MRIALAGLLLSLLCPMSAIASHSTSYFSDSGCGEIVAVKMGSHAGNAYGSYALGFIAGVNFKTDRTISLDSEAIESWVWNYCKENPLNSLNDAVQALDIELDK